MNEIVQYIPAFVDTGDEPRRRARFDSLAQLLEVPFVKRWIEEEGFYKFSVSGPHLMAEMRGGRSWWVVGLLRYPAPDLPQWDEGIYEVVGPNGETLDVPGKDVASSCGDDVRLHDGRVMKRRR